jgi:hypothetical protein
VLNPFPPGTAESRAWDLFQELLWTRDVEMRAARGTGLTDNEQAALWLEIQKLCGVWSVLPTPQIKKE